MFIRVRWRGVVGVRFEFRGTIVFLFIMVGGVILGFLRKGVI